MAKQAAIEQDGVIVEEGTHEELMAKNGKYAYMFGIQSQYYEEKQKNSDNAESTKTNNNGDAKKVSDALSFLENSHGKMIKCIICFL